MLRRDRRVRTMMTGLLTAMVWVCSLLQVSVATDTMPREVARAFVSALPAVASHASTVRLEKDGPSRHGTLQSSGLAAATRAMDPRARGRAIEARVTDDLPAPARYRIAPHDATAPPASDVSA